MTDNQQYIQCLLNSLTKAVKREIDSTSTIRRSVEPKEYQQQVPMNIVQDVIRHVMPDIGEREFELLAHAVFPMLARITFKKQFARWLQEKQVQSVQEMAYIIMILITHFNSKGSDPDAEATPSRSHEQPV